MANVNMQCPECGMKYNLEINTMVNNVLTPEFKDKILKETFFDWTCNECEYTAQMVYPMIYTDPQRNYIIALTPTTGLYKMLSSTENLENVTKRRVKSLSELKEKLLIFDCKLNDIAVEITKNALRTVISKNYPEQKIKLYFSELLEDGSMNFAVVISGEDNFIYHQAKQEVYEQSFAVLKAIQFKSQNEFLRVGPTLASQILEKYKTI